MINFKSIIFALIFSITLFLTGCASTDVEEVNMPPSPPPERIQSSIFPETATEVTPPAPEIPAGIILLLKGKEVDYTLLATVPDPQKRTVIVSANPSTPYRDISEVLERLHDMGFLVSFKAGE